MSIVDKIEYISFYLCISKIFVQVNKSQVKIDHSQVSLGFSLSYVSQTSNIYALLHIHRGSAISALSAHKK